MESSLLPLGESEVDSTSVCARATDRDSELWGSLLETIKQVDNCSHLFMVADSGYCSACTGDDENGDE